MWRLAIALASAIVLLVGGCAGDGSEGDLCDRTEECDEGMVCATEVFGCNGEDCWGTCERECDVGTSCEAGEICEQVGEHRVCLADDYEDPR